ncbi:MAG: hypothetical protein WC211_10805 [Dehalococcoidia bacterium]
MGDELAETALTPAERLEAMRLADVLDALDTGAPTPMSATEDPELASLVQTAGLLRDGMAASTETTSFQSYRARSRAYILHTLEEQHRAAEAARHAAQRRDGLVPFVRRRWAVLAPVAAAAAVAAFTLATTDVGAPTGGSSDGGAAVASNRTAASTDAELDRIRQAVELLNMRAQRGEPVDASLLRTITETSSAVANKIEAAPQLVSREHVATYQRALTQSTTVLTTVQPAAGSEDALAAAQRATQDGVVAAARYLGTDATPSATATAKPSATPKPATTPTATAAPSATATPTAAPSATPTATPGEGAVRP